MNMKKNEKNNKEHVPEERKEIPTEAGEKEEKVVFPWKEAEELRKKAAERDEYHDKWMRTLAEYDNARKRMEKDRVNHIKYANEDLILELLGILDNLERGIKSAEVKKDFDLLHQGVEMTEKQLHDLLAEKGLKKVKCVGEKFDPFKCEALEVVAGPADKDGMVTEELQAGYELNGRIIRPAKVKVVKSEGSLSGTVGEEEETVD